jgi:hypothetical protein
MRTEGCIVSFLAHAGGVCADPPVGRVVQADLVEHVGDPAGHRNGRGGAAPGEVGEVPPTAQIPGERRSVHQRADAAQHWKRRAHRGAVQPHGATLRANQPDQHADRRLAGSVRSQEPEHASGRHLQ